MGKLNGKVALVTGAASGIGRACAQRLVQEGASVVATDIDAHLGETCVNEIACASGKAIFLRHDVANEENWISVIAETKSRFGRLDVLVNNAGIAIAGQITELSLADWRRQIGINLDGVFLGTKHGLPLMRAGGGGANTKHISRGPAALSARVVPMGVPGQPEDIAAGVIYLTSDEARYVTGTEPVIAGGRA